MDGAGRNLLHFIRRRTGAAILLMLVVHAGIAVAAETAGNPAAPTPTNPAGGTSAEKTLIRRSVDATRTSPQNRPSATSTSGTLRVVFALVAVIGMIFAAKWAGRRFLGIQLAGSGAGVIRVLSRTTLSHKQQILAIQVGRRVVVAVNGGARVDTLTEITDPEEVTELVGQLQQKASNNAVPGFGSLFGRANEPYRPLADSPVPAAAEETDSHYEDESAPPERDAGSVEVDPAEVEGRRREIGGLLDRVRALSKQFGAARPEAAPPVSAGPKRKLTS